MVGVTSFILYLVSELGTVSPIHPGTTVSLFSVFWRSQQSEHRVLCHTTRNTFEKVQTANLTKKEVREVSRYAGPEDDEDNDDDDFDYDEDCPDPEDNDADGIGDDC